MPAWRRQSRGLGVSSVTNLLLAEIESCYAVDMSKLGCALIAAGLCLFLVETAMAWYTGSLPHLVTFRHAFGALGEVVFPAVGLPLWVLNQSVVLVLSSAGIAVVVLYYLFKPAHGR